MNTLKDIIPRFLIVEVIVCAIVIFLSALAETLGLSMIMPLLVSLLDDGEAGYISTLLTRIFGESLSLNIILVIILFMFLIKFILGIVKNYMMYGFEWKLRAHWMNTFYQFNTLKEYQAFERSKPGIITNEIINETIKAASALRQILEFFGQSILILGLLTVLLISNILYSSVFLFIAFLFIIIIRFTIMDKVSIYGSLRQDFEGNVYHEVSEMIHGMKTIRFLELESFLFKRFVPKTRELFLLMRTNETIRRLPTQIIEIIFILVFVIGLFIAKEDPDFNVVSLLPFIGMLVVISIKLFTNIGTVVSNITAIVNLWVSVETIQDIMAQAKYHQLKIQSKEFIKKDTFDHEIKFNNIKFYYQKNELILNDLDVTFRKGTFNVITGPSGSGKSTLSKILIGLYKPISGSISIDGVDTNRISSINLRKIIGYVDQEYFFFNGTVLENLQHKLPDITEEKINQVLEITNAKGFIDKMPEGLNTIIGDKGDLLSTGQKARLAFSRALLMEPQVLILDEITSALDRKSSDYIIQTLCELKKKMTIISISHDPLVIDQAENLFELNNLGLIKIN